MAKEKTAAAGGKGGDPDPRPGLRTVKVPAPFALVFEAAQSYVSRYFAGLLRSLSGCGVPDGPSGVTVRPTDASGSSYRGVRISPAPAAAIQ